MAVLWFLILAEFFLWISVKYVQSVYIGHERLPLALQIFPCEMSDMSFELVDRITV